MCGRFTLTANPQHVRDIFNLNATPDLPGARFNIAPTQPVAVITNENAKALTFFRWGLVPSWAKDLAMGSKMINARAETVHEKPAFRAAFRRRRCLIPADGYYEWTADGKDKIPHFIHMKDRDVFAFAGLWEVWQNPEGDRVFTCTIITTEANDFMQPLHHRMPVILARDAWDEWLLPDEQPVERLIPLLQPYHDSAAMAEYPVSKLVNRPAYDVPGAIEPVA